MTSLDDAEAARALLTGAHPDHPDRLLTGRRPTPDPRSRLRATPLLEAIDTARAGSPAHTSSWAGERLARARRGLAREGVAHRVAYRDALRLAREHQVDLAAAYPAADLAQARAHQAAPARTAEISGYRLQILAPTSYSILWALSPAGQADELARMLNDAALDAVGAAAAWAPYATHPPRTGVSVVGWAIPRLGPPAGPALAPRLGLEFVLADLLLDRGRVRTLTGSGFEPTAAAAILDALTGARLRDLTSQRLGIEWYLDGYQERYQLTRIPRALRRGLGRAGPRRAGTAQTPAPHQGNGTGPAAHEASHGHWTTWAHELGFPPEPLADLARPAAAPPADLTADHKIARDQLAERVRENRRRARPRRTDRAARLAAALEAIPPTGEHDTARDLIATAAAAARAADTTRQGA